MLGTEYPVSITRVPGNSFNLQVNEETTTL